jgi:hypothetical protein
MAAFTSIGAHKLHRHIPFPILPAARTVQSETAWSAGLPPPAMSSATLISIGQTLAGIAASPAFQHRASQVRRSMVSRSVRFFIDAPIPSFWVSGFL